MDKRKLSKTLWGASSKLHQTSCFYTLNQVPFLVGGLDGIMLFITAHGRDMKTHIANMFSYSQLQL